MFPDEFFYIIYALWVIGGIWCWKTSRLFRPSLFEDFVMLTTNVIMAPWFVAIKIAKRFK